MKKLIVLLACLFLFGCTQKIVNVTFSPVIEGDGDALIKLHTDRSTITTDDDPTNAPDISPEVDFNGLKGEI